MLLFTIRYLKHLQKTNTFDVTRWTLLNTRIWDKEEIKSVAELTCWTKTSIENDSKYLYGNRSGICI